MNYTRYEVRNACNRKKKGLQPFIPEIIDIIEPLMTEKNYGWHSFGSYWDIIIHPTNGIVVVPCVKDLPVAENVCSQMKIVSEMGADKEWNDQETSVIALVEAQFLDGIMTWQNYRSEWALRKNADTARLETYLIKRKSDQKIEDDQALVDQKIQKLKELQSSNTAEEARDEINTVQTKLTLGEDK